MQVYAISDSDALILRQNNYMIAEDYRIGFYLPVESYDFLPSSVKNRLTVTVPFNLDDEQTDANNSIIILPTMMSKEPEVQALFDSVYLICTKLTFCVNLGSSIISNALVPNPLFFTVIEVKELTESDKLLVDGFKQLHNSRYPTLQISDPLWFESKVEFNEFLRNLKGI